jgi:hypothetical protein
MAYTTIDDPSAYFKVQLYTGTGSSNAITFNDTDTDMQPDAVWIKQRDSTDAHVLFDAVRGVQKMLQPNATSAQGDESTTLTAFGSDGFTVISDSAVNSSSGSYVSWNWKANVAGSANTAGSINTTATSVGTTQGFSIMQYEGNVTAGATIGHGLGAVPQFMIFKNIDAVRSWYVYHHKNTAAPATDYLKLDTSAATADFDGLWNDTVPSSTLVTLGDGSDTNGDGETHIAYCWSEKQGFSKFGGYTGNGNADGTFIYCGFRPAYVFVKKTSGTGQWTQWDNKRHPINRGDNTSSGLALNTTAAEATDEVMSLDFLSNGFKMRDTQVDRNGSGTTNIFAAFAEAPFVNSNGVPCNAR